MSAPYLPIVERVKAALAEHDATMANCPVNHPKFGKVYGPDDRCDRCGAKASGSCGISSSAGWHLAESIRAALRAQSEAGQ